MRPWSVIFWRRIDVEGLERLELTVGPEGVTAASAVICLEAGGFRLEHRWRLDPDWRAQSVTVERWNAQDHGGLRLERARREILQLLCRHAQRRRISHAHSKCVIGDK